MDNKNKRKKRAAYLIAAAVLFGTEVFIALFVHDRFVRPYLGDVLVVLLLYAFVRIFISERIALLPLYIFLFASAVEALQYFELVKVLGLEKNRVLSVVLGSTFDWKDIGCYAVGCLLLGLYEVFCRRRRF